MVGGGNPRVSRPVPRAARASFAATRGLTIDRLEERCRSGELSEVIVATNPTVEGETTALYILRRLRAYDVEVSRPASGIPMGGELAAVDQLTLARALQSRRKV